eukprot:scaffold117_cov188-Alexandrium_tamarense.AAC.1
MGEMRCAGCVMRERKLAEMIEDSGELGWMAFVRRCYGEFNETANGFKSAAFGMISSPANWMKTRKCTPSTSRVEGINRWNRGTDGREYGSCRTCRSNQGTGD